MKKCKKKNNGIEIYELKYILDYFCLESLRFIEFLLFFILYFRILEEELNKFKEKFW